jgi:hypothetical protein
MRHISKFFLTGIIILCSFSLSAYAVSMNDVSFIFGGEGGVVFSDLPDKNLIEPSVQNRNPTIFPTSQSQSLHPFGWGLHAGLEIPKPGTHWLYGLQIDYQNFGQSEYDVTNSDDAVSAGVGRNGYRHVSVWSVGLLGTLRYKWDNGFNVFTKLGPALVKTHIKQENIVSSRNPGQESIYDVDENITNAEPEAVVGLGWRFNSHVGVYTDFTYVYGENDDSYDAGDDGVLSVPGQSPAMSMIAGGVNIIV